MAEIVLAVAATVAPLGPGPDEMAKVPLLVGTVVLLAAGEAVRLACRRGGSPGRAAGTGAGTPAPGV